MLYLLKSLFDSNLSTSKILAVIIAYLLAIVFALTLHEFAHAFTAYRLGDYTPKAMGRLSANPLRHLDVFGILGFLFVGFGWAKPVPINQLNFKNYKKGTFFVSISGVLTNFILAFIFSGLFLLFFVNCAKYNIDGNLTANSIFKILEAGNFSYGNDLLFFIHYLLSYFIVINIALCCFNLIPIFPLDGFNIMSSLFKLSHNFLNFMYKWGNIILLIFIFTPFFDIIYNITTTFIQKIFFNFWGIFI